MRTALRTKEKSVGMQVNRQMSYPAATGGWNARDALSSMSETDAIVLDNWFPETSYCEIRGGWAEHATGMTGSGKTLMIYNTLIGTHKMFCATSAGVYDVSSAGAVGAAVVTRTNGKHHWFNYGDGTNNYLIAFNGVDKPLFYDGTTWIEVDGVSSPALTGITTTSLISGFPFKNRLIVIEKNSLSFWYLAAGAAGGALTEFDISGETPKGGYLLAATNWTMDGGAGIDDHAVFVTSEGDVIIYKGTNPAAANTWAKVGTFSVPKPIGRNCLIQYGADILIITEGGVFPLGKTLVADTIDKTKLAFSYKIQHEFIETARAYRDHFGWSAHFYPERNALIINIPEAEDGTHYQYVMNTLTGSWCRFTEWDAETFAIFNSELYFAVGTSVVKAWTGAVDGTSNIVAYAKTAFTHFNDISSNKHVKLFRPILSVNGSITFQIGVDVDFRDVELSGTVSYTSNTGAIWDTALWDDGLWGSGLEVTREWATPPAYIGRYIAGKLRVNTNVLTVRWLATDYIYERGQGL